MGQNWAITIGINQYDNLQPLQYAKRDAAEMRDYFLNEAGFEQVYYFADDARDIELDYGPPFKPVPTYAKLERFLDIRFEQDCLGAGDNFWFFFAGHGKRYRNRDYLLPSDVNPRNIERTAISIHYVTERLRRCGADNVILLLDACRTEGERDGEGIGIEQQKGVVTLFSCSPSERSYEIDELQQGAFTYALLKSLRLREEGNCATVERLYEYLRLHVPQLNCRYNKPIQTPYSVVEPITKSHLILFPQWATQTDIGTLKTEARNAELRQEYLLARQLWIRTLATSPDSEAIEGIERLAKALPASYIPAPSVALRINSSDGLSLPIHKEIEDLKTEAQKSELSQEHSVARQLWIRLLTVSLSNPEAIAGLERLARMSPAPKATPRIKPKLDNSVYTKLQHALENHDWREADRETYLLMLQAVGRKPKELGWLRQKEIPKLHQNLICTIDQLWTSYSSNQFGFSIQQQLWQEAGGQVGVFDANTFEEFGNNVGWRNNGSWVVRYDDFCFSLAANEGHLPSLSYEQGNKISWWNDWRNGFENILPHIHTCLSKCSEC